MARITEPRIAQTSSAGGSGPFALDGNLIDHRQFSSACSVGDEFWCDIAAIDPATYLPIGPWMEGLGVYSAADEVTLTSLYRSSNGNAPVTFAPGLIVVRIIADARQIAKLEYSRRTVSATPPLDPVEPEVWVRTSDLVEFTWLEDADSGQWVALGSDGASERQGLTQLVDGATITVDLSDMAKVYQATIAGDRVFAFTGGAARMTGEAFFLDVIQGAGGNHAPDLSAFTFGDDVTSPITFSTTAGKRDLVGLTYRHPDVFVTSYSRGYPQ